MGVNSFPKTVTLQRRGCDLTPGPTVPEASTLTTRLPSHPGYRDFRYSKRDGVLFAFQRRPFSGGTYGSAGQDGITRVTGQTEQPVHLIGNTFN